MADLFLSYSPKDAEIAHKIAKSLEQRGSSIYYNRPEELDTTSLQMLDHEMSLSSWIIVLWSGNALQDGRITYEAMYAKEKNNLLSVQLQPNSIPADYNNAHSPDHVNYQNQLTGIIQQTLNPAPEPKPTAEVQQSKQQEPMDVAPDTITTPEKEAIKEAKAPQEQISKTKASKPPTEQATAPVMPTQQETLGIEKTSTQLPKNPEQGASIQPTLKEGVSTKPEAVKQETAAKIQKENPVQPVKVDNTVQRKATSAPQANLQKAQTEALLTARPVTKDIATNSKTVQPSAPKVDSTLKVRPVAEVDAKQRQLKALPVNSKGSVRVEGQQQPPTTTAAPNQTQQKPISNAAMAAAQPASQTSKIVPLALMLVGSVLLGSLGAGYWYLANNKPHTTKSAVAETRVIKRDPSPVKVAVVTPPSAPKPIAQPQRTKPVAIAPKKAAAPTKPKGLVSIEDDPLLSSIIQRIPTQQAPQPAPKRKQQQQQQQQLAASAPKTKPAGQKAVARGTERAENMLIQASATRGGKSVSQCQGCHTFKKGGPNKSGPNLYGVMNQLIGSERKFSYSDTLRSMGAIGEVWSKDQLDCYLKNPAVCMPGTKMSFHGIRSQRKRADIIAYLETLQN